MKLNFYIFAVICVLFLAHNYYLDQKGVEFEPWIFQARLVVLLAIFAALLVSGIILVIKFFRKRKVPRLNFIDTIPDDEKWVL